MIRNSKWNILPQLIYQFLGSKVSSLVPMISTCFYGVFHHLLFQSKAKSFSKNNSMKMKEEGVDDVINCVVRFMFSFHLLSFLFLFGWIEYVIKNTVISSTGIKNQRNSIKRNFICNQFSYFNIIVEICAEISGCVSDSSSTLHQIMNQMTLKNMIKNPMNIIYF